MKANLKRSTFTQVSGNKYVLSLCIEDENETNYILVTIDNQKIKDIKVI